jgi:hypothetical protein
MFIDLASVLSLWACVQAPHWFGAKEPVRRQYVQYGSLALFVVFYSMLLVMFRVKNATYPYKILF